MFSLSIELKRANGECGFVSNVHDSLAFTVQIISRAVGVDTRCGGNLKCRYTWCALFICVICEQGGAGTVRVSECVCLLTNMCRLVHFKAVLWVSLGRD